MMQLGWESDFKWQNVFSKKVPGSRPDTPYLFSVKLLSNWNDLACWGVGGLDFKCRTLAYHARILGLISVTLYLDNFE